MTRLLLLAHAPLASAMREVALHAFPECAEGLMALDVDASTAPDELDARLARALEVDPPGDEILILVDAFGASPANAAVRLADGHRVRVVSGLSVPMLWRTLCYRNEALDALVDRAVAGGVQGAMQLSVPPRQHQTGNRGPTDHDQVQHRHSQ